MSEYKPIRVTEAARILEVSSGTVRNWCKQGKLKYNLSASGQKVFRKEDLIAYKNEKLGITNPTTQERIVFYARSSSSDDVTMNTQIDKLTQAYGEPALIYKDKASGLNDKRAGLNRLIKTITNDNNTITHVAITNKDRLTRFGYRYLESFFEYAGVQILVLDDKDTKEPYQVLMDDFMSLVAVFAGKFYRLRGWEQRKKFLKEATKVADEHGNK